MYSGVFFLSFPAADELRCWRSAERTAGRENQELGAELVSAVTGSLFTVIGEPDLGVYSIACLLLLLMDKSCLSMSHLHVYFTFKQFGKRLHPERSRVISLYYHHYHHRAERDATVGGTVCNKIP